MNLKNLIYKILDFIDRIARWIDRRFLICGDEIPRDICLFFNRIKRIIAYAPILYWDYNFNCDPGIFALMKKKLELLEPELVHHLYAERDKKRIRMCITLLYRVINDTYENEFHKKHDAKWGKSSWRFEPCEDQPGFSELFFDRRNVRTAEEKEQERCEFMAGTKHAYEQKQKAIDFVMKTIAKYAMHWWD